MIDNFNKILASYSVTRTLYDSGNGLYDILQKYITAIIHENNRYSFSLSWMTNEINVVGGFDLKEPIIKTCLKQMGITLVGSDYTCNPKDIKLDDNWKNATEEAYRDNRYLL